VTLNRNSIIQELTTQQLGWDVIVVGGGATGLGCAVESAARGYRTLLLEAHDFAKGTSSRSTKLVHGGVRYLRQGNVKLVVEALRERGRMLRNAPHLAGRRPFVIPAYSGWELPFYGVGLKLYDLLAGRESIGRSRVLGAAQVRRELPGVGGGDLKGGILYYDGQFDDARFAIALLGTLFDLGGAAINYAPVIELVKENGRIAGVLARDDESGATLELKAAAVVNATGIFVDDLRAMDQPQSRRIVTVSQGSHIVLPRSFLPGDSALMIPKTSDGRVLFAIPWHDRVIVGTTDDAVPQADIEPLASVAERKFLLDHVERFLGRRPSPEEILSVWSGQRPLVRHGEDTGTAGLSREHTILISPAKLITVTGGKWTTYRKMAQDTIDRASVVAGLKTTPSRTAELRLHGWSRDMDDSNAWEKVYGADLRALRRLAVDEPDLGRALHPNLPVIRAEVIWAARQEMARTVEDVLARRTRSLFMDARASLAATPDVARLLARELNRDELWENAQIASFAQLAQGYIWQ
jgi:glycerol-3-phosphate dehydrogenase